MPSRGELADTENPGVISTLSHRRAMAGDIDKARQLADKARSSLQERIRARKTVGSKRKLCSRVGREGSCAVLASTTQPREPLVSIDYS